MHAFQCKLIKHPTTAWDRDKLTLVLDGEPLLESWVHKPIIVHEQETPIVGRTMRAGSVDASRLLAKIPIAELLAEFETVHVSIEPEIGEFIGNDVAITRRKVDGIRNSRILFEISLEDGNQDAINIETETGLAGGFQHVRSSDRCRPSGHRGASSSLINAMSQ